MIPRWLARWFERPPVIYFPGDTRRANGLPSAEDHAAKNGWFRNQLDLMPINIAASTLSRHGHAKRRASYREFHDAMAKAAGRPPIVWR